MVQWNKPKGMCDEDKMILQGWLVTQRPLKIWTEQFIQSHILWNYNLSGWWHCFLKICDQNLSNNGSNLILNPLDNSYWAAET